MEPDSLLGGLVEFIKTYMFVYNSKNGLEIWNI